MQRARFGKGQPNWAALHGFTGSGAAFESVETALPGAWWRPELPGHESQAWPASITDFASLCAFITERLQAELPSPRILLGYSMGGRIGAAAWMAHPSLFEGAVLIGVHPGGLTPEARAHRTETDRARAEALKQDPQAFLQAWDRQAMFGARPSPRRSVVDGPGLARALLASSLADMPDCRSFLEARHREGRLSILVGEHDEKFRGLWGHRARLVPATHHDVLSEAPTAVVEAAEDLRRRLRSLPD